MRTDIGSPPYGSLAARESPPPPPEWAGGGRGGTEQVVPAEQSRQGHAAEPGGTAGEEFTPVEQLATGE